MQHIYECWAAGSDETPDMMEISIAGDRLSVNLSSIKVFVDSVWGRGYILDTKTLRSLICIDMIG